MDPDWKALAPHRPLDPGSEQYVETGNAETFAKWVLANPTTSTLLLGGPVGIGKSTELASVATLLQSERNPCLVQLDRFENMRRLTPDGMLLRIAERSARFATERLNLPISTRLPQELDTYLEPGAYRHPGTTPRNIARAALAEIARLGAPRRISLLIDGLEKVPEGPACIELFDTLAQLGEEIDLIVVVPWHIAYGPRADAVLRPGERFWSLGVREVQGNPGQPGRRFLGDILRRRLPLVDAPPEFEQLVDAAGQWSGGLPRTFLQIVADAATYAQLRRNAPWPDSQDLAAAVADQQDSFQRVLLPGDLAALEAVDGTNGLEMDLARKVRLLAHGLLLERVGSRLPMLKVHPLISPLLAEQRRA